MTTNDDLAQRIRTFLQQSAPHHRAREWHLLLEEAVVALAATPVRLPPPVKVFNAQRVVIEVRDKGFLLSYEDTMDGRGHVAFTADRALAMTFATHKEAFVFWRQTSKTAPKRPDGKPNRPLTAYTVDIHS